MKRRATAFVAVWCVLSVTCALVMIHFTMADNTKLTQLIMANSILLVGLGVFFAVYRDKIAVLLGNYKREKEI